MVSVAPLLPWGPAEVDEVDESLLVTEDDTPLDSILTEKQERLLSEPLYTSWSGPPPAEDGLPRPFVVMANVGLFSAVHEPPVVPDVMLSLDVSIPEDLSEKKNRSYFLWRYGKPPEVVIELVSNTKGGELGERRRRYARMRVDYYVVYDPLKALSEVPLRTFELREGAYVERVRPWFERVGLGLVEWEGTFEGLAGRWLRWSTREGLVPTGAERAADEKARAEAAKADAEAAKADAKAAKANAKAANANAKAAKANAKAANADAVAAKAGAEVAKADADRERVRAERLEARLRALGIDPDGEG